MGGRRMCSWALVLWLVHPVPARSLAPPMLELPLASGYLETLFDNGFALRVDAPVVLEAAALGPLITAVRVIDEGHVMGVEPGPEAPSVELALPEGVAYGVVQLSLTSAMRPAEVAGRPVHWEGNGPWYTILDLELYRGERSAVESWLSGVRPIYQATPRNCGHHGEVPKPVHATSVDLDGDGQPEGLTTVSAAIGVGGPCRWTEVHTLEAIPRSLGQVPNGWPYFSILPTRAPTGAEHSAWVVPLISSHYESGDLYQEFVVLELRNGALATVFDNDPTPDGRAGYGYWADGPSGPEILFAADLETYSTPAHPALSVYRYDGTSFAPVAQGGGSLTGGPTGVGQVCQWGELNRGAVLEEPAPCADGLTCCYPCGIQGCDWVCVDVPGGACPAFP